jgi:hypothetical protein
VPAFKEGVGVAARTVRISVNVTDLSGRC